MDKPIYINAKRAAEIIGCSTQHIYNLINRGELPCRRFGNLIRIPLGAIEGTEICDSSSTEASGPSDSKTATNGDGSPQDSSLPRKIVRLPNGRKARGLQS